MAVDGGNVKKCAGCCCWPGKSILENVKSIYPNDDDDYYYYLLADHMVGYSSQSWNMQPLNNSQKTSGTLFTFCRPYHWCRFHSEWYGVCRKEGTIGTDSSYSTWTSEERSSAGLEVEFKFRIISSRVGDPDDNQTPFEHGQRRTIDPAGGFINYLIIILWSLVNFTWKLHSPGVFFVIEIGTVGSEGRLESGKWPPVLATVATTQLQLTVEHIEPSTQSPVVVHRSIRLLCADF